MTGGFTDLTQGIRVRITWLETASSSVKVQMKNSFKVTGNSFIIHKKEYY